MEIIGYMQKKSNKKLALYAVIIILAVISSMLFPVGLYGDSEQFISMHLQREPVYPLFISLFRLLFHSIDYLRVVVIVQSLLNGFAIIWVLQFTEKRYTITFPVQLLFAIFLLMPHIVSPIFSQTHLILTCGIMNEAIALPLFLFFMTQIMSYVYDGKRKDAVSSIILAFLLSLTRGQMMVTLIVWIIVVSARFIYLKKRLLILLIIGLGLFAFVARGLVYKSYNYLVNGAFVAGVCDNVNRVTNIIYASDRESGKYIQNEVARELFYEIYDASKEQGLLYTDAPDSLYYGTAHLEAAHDQIKFNYILEICNAYYYDNIGEDYLERNIWVDDRCREMVQGLWNHCFGRWTINYLLLGYNGLCRTIGITHPLIWIPMGLILIFALVLCIRCLKQKRNYKECLLMLVSGLFICGNAFATALFIMCLSRYMVYGFSFFYIALFLLMRGEFKRWTEKRKQNEL